MARLLGFVSMRAEPMIVKRFPSWRQALERVSARKGPSKSGQWVSPNGNAGVLYVESDQSPFLGAPEYDGQGLMIVEGAVHWGKKSLSALDVLDQFHLAGNRFLDYFQGAFSVLRLLSFGRGVEIYRDRYGMKPMFYRIHKGIFFFSSYASLLAAIPTGRREPNRDLLALYASSHYSTVFGRRPTFFRDVFQAPPASVLTWSGSEPIERVLWRFDKGKPFLKDPSEDDLKSEMNALLEKAIGERIAPLPARRGFSLSGGMDSNTVLGYVKKLTGEKQVAVSITYHANDRANENDLIEPVAKAHLALWHNIKPTPAEFKNDIETLYRHYDQPWTTATVYAQERLNRGASEVGLDCLISGSGGDHHMAGAYPNFLYYFAHLRQSGKEALLRHEVAKWIDYHSTSQWPKTMDTVESFFRTAVDIHVPGVLVQNDARLVPGKSLLTPSAESVLKTPAPVESYGDYLRSYVVQEITKDALPPALWAEDIMGWRYGLMACDPFWDRELFDFSWSLPHHFKIRDGMNKYLLRRVTKGLVLDHIRLRKAKTGFNLPFDLWLQKDLSGLAYEVLESATLQSRDIVDPTVALDLLGEHRTGRGRHGMVIWQIMNMELWFREWIDKSEMEMALC